MGNIKHNSEFGFYGQTVHRSADFVKTSFLARSILTYLGPKISQIGHHLRKRAYLPMAKQNGKGIEG